MTFRNYIGLGTFILLVLMTSFFSGEWSKWLQAIIFVLVFLLAFFTYRSRAYEENADRPMQWYLNPNVMLLGFLVIAGVTTFFSHNIYDSVTELVYLVGYGIIYYCAYAFFRTWQRIRIFLIALFSIGILGALIGLGMFMFQSSDRVNGLLFNANAISSFLLIPLFLGIGMLVAYWRTWARWWLFSGIVIMIVAMALTYSYTAWAAMLIPLYLFLRQYARRMFTWRNVIIVVVILVAGFCLLAGVRYAHSRDFVDALKVHETISSSHFFFSFSQRLYFNETALDIFRDNPIVGSGLATYQDLYSRYYHTINEQPRYAHDYYLQTAAEIGIFGFLALVYFMVTLFRSAYRTVRGVEDRQRKTLLWMLSLGLLASALHTAVDFGWEFPAVFLQFWIGAGIIVGWYQTQRNEADTITPVRRHGNWLWGGVLLLAFVVFLRGITVFVGAYSFDLGETSIEQAEYEQGISNYETGLTYDPDPAEYAVWAGTIAQYHALFPDEKLTEATDTITHLTITIPDDYLMWWTLGRLEFSGDNNDQAIVAYDRAIELNPVFRPDIYYDLAFLYYDEGEYQQSIDTIYTILNQYPVGVSSSNPNLPTQLAFLKLLLAQNYKSMNHLDLARFYAEQALKLKPDFSLAQGFLNGLEK